MNKELRDGLQKVNWKVETMKDVSSPLIIVLAWVLQKMIRHSVIAEQIFDRLAMGIGRRPVLSE